MQPKKLNFFTCSPIKKEKKRYLNNCTLNENIGQNEKRILKEPILN